MNNLLYDYKNKCFRCVIGLKCLLTTVLITLLSNGIFFDLRRNAWYLQPMMSKNSLETQKYDEIRNHFTPANLK